MVAPLHQNNSWQLQRLMVRGMFYSETWIAYIKGATVRTWFSKKKWWSPNKTKHNLFTGQCGVAI